jgi:hypothetical protein
LAYTQDFEEIFDTTILGMNASYDTFQVRKTFRDTHECSFKGWVVHNILHGVESEFIEKFNIQYKKSNEKDSCLAFIAETSRNGMHNQILNSRFPNAVTHRPRSFKSVPSSVPSLLSRTLSARQICVDQGEKDGYFKMRQCLSI